MTIYPALRYHHAAAAIAFLEQAFGFERVAVGPGDNGEIVHAELRYGDGMIMLGTEGEDDRGYGRHAGEGWNYVVVDDPDAHYERARAAGAEIVKELEDLDYGSRDYSA